MTMATRKVKDLKDLDTGELIYAKGHAKATYMSNGQSVEDAINNINNINNINDIYILDITIADIRSRHNTKESFIISDAIIDAIRAKKRIIVYDTIDNNSYAEVTNTTLYVEDDYFELYVSILNDTDSISFESFTWNKDSNTLECLVVKAGTFVTSDTLPSEVQGKLYSGVNIKTINGSSILGSGNMDIKGVIPDWNTFDSSSISYIKNRTHGIIYKSANYSPGSRFSISVDTIEGDSIDNYRILFNNIYYKLPTTTGERLYYPNEENYKIGIRLGGININNYYCTYTYFYDQSQFEEGENSIINIYKISKLDPAYLPKGTLNIKDYLSIKPEVKIFNSADLYNFSVYFHHPYCDYYDDGELVLMRYSKSNRPSDAIIKRYAKWGEAHGAELKVDGDRIIASHNLPTTFSNKTWIPYDEVIEKIARVTTLVPYSDAKSGYISMLQALELYPDESALSLLQTHYYNNEDCAGMFGRRQFVKLGIALRIPNPEWNHESVDKQCWYKFENGKVISKYIYSNVCEIQLSSGDMLHAMPKLIVK